MNRIYNHIYIFTNLLRIDNNDDVIIKYLKDVNKVDNYFFAHAFASAICLDKPRYAKIIQNYEVDFHELIGVYCVCENSKYTRVYTSECRRCDIHIKLSRSLYANLIGVCVKSSNYSIVKILLYENKCYSNHMHEYEHFITGSGFYQLLYKSRGKCILPNELIRFLSTFF